MKEIGKKEIITDIQEWINPRHNVVLDQTIGTRGFKKVAELCCTYVDLVHFFGEPLKLIGADRRVEWGFREDQTDIAATIYDDKPDLKLDEILYWAVGGHCDRSFEMIGQLFVEKKLEGVEFVSTELTDEEGTN